MTTTHVRTSLAVLSGVGRTYGTGDATVHALRDVDLTLERGELVVVLGPSGSGKTTLLNILGAIETPSSGSVVVAGHDLGGTDRELTQVRRDVVSFVFQFFNLVPTLTARENVAVIAELTGRGDRAAVEAALRGVGLADRGDRFPAQLSGGQQQRVAIARALVGTPDLILCDEPTGALDPQTGREVLTLLRAAVDDGRTVVLVTHNRAIAAMADRVLVLGAGRIESDTRVDHPLPAAEVTW